MKWIHVDDSQRFSILALPPRRRGMVAVNPDERMKEWEPRAAWPAMRTWNKIHAHGGKYSLTSRAIRETLAL